MENSANNTVISGKLNPLFIVNNMISALPAIILVNFSVVGAAGASGEAFPALAIAGIALSLLIEIIIALCGFIYYKFFNYYLEPSQFRIKKGVVFKKQEHLAYQKIQNIGQTASLIQRLMGLCALKVESAGGSGNTSLTLISVKKKDAEILRRELFARKNHASGVASEHVNPQKTGVSCEVSASEFASAQASAKANNILDAAAGITQEIESELYPGEVNTGKVKFEQGLSNRDLVLASLGINQVVFVYTFILVGFLGSLPAALLTYVEQYASMATSYLTKSISGMSLAAIFLFAITTIFSVVLLSGLVTIISNALSFGGFTVRRKDQRIEVERGVIKRVYDGVDIDKIQYIRIHQSLIHRLFKGCKIIVGKVESAESVSSANSGTTAAGHDSSGFCVCPFIPYAKAAAFMHSLAPELNFDIPVSANLPLPALRKAIFRKAIFYNPALYIILTALVVYALYCVQFGGQIAPTVSTALLFGLYVALVVLALFTLWQIIDAILWYKGSGYGIKGSRIAIKNSGFDVKEEYFAKNKIQNITMRSTPFQRRSNTCTACIRCAAGVGGATTKLFDISHSDGNTHLEWFRPEK